MMDKPRIDQPAAHRYFAVNCFNTAWELIDKPDRTPEEDLDMLHRAVASLWHWTQRADCTATNRSIGYWQVSRVYALLGQAENSRRYAELCREVSQADGFEPFHLAYAYEALARAEKVAGKPRYVKRHLHRAQQLAQQVKDREERESLMRDLDSLS